MWTLVTTQVEPSEERHAGRFFQFDWKLILDNHKTFRLVLSKYLNTMPKASLKDVLGGGGVAYLHMYILSP